MARPESIADITPDPIVFAHFETQEITTHGALLKAYGTFMEAVQRVEGATVEASNYGRVDFKRMPTIPEQLKQLESAQNTWDLRQRNYEQMRSVGRLEHSYLEDYTKTWAEAEGLPWPPEHEEIKPLDVVIRDIDEAVSDNG